MKNNFIILMIPLLIFCNCEKEDIIMPEPSFSFRGDTTTLLKMATYDTCTLNNSSKNADSVFWDLGDGRISTEKHIILSYSKSGIYNLRLTVKNKDGQSASLSKKVIILDRVLKNVYVKTVYWNPINTNGWPTTSTADVYFQIQEYTDISVINYSIYPNCPIIYTSPTIKNISSSTSTSFTIPITEKIVIDKQLIQFAYPGNINKAYVFSLMAKDKDGNVFCLQNNYGGGGNYFGILKENFKNNEFVIQNGPFSHILLNCDFE